MSDVYREVNRSMLMARVAAFAVRPLDSGLTLDELRSLVILDGHSAPLFDEAWDESNRGRRFQKLQHVELQHMDLLVMRSQEGYPRQIPYAEAETVCRVFEQLNRQLGVKSPKTLEMLAREGLSTGDAARGLGLLLQLRVALSVPGGYACEQKDLRGYGAVGPRGSDLERELETVMDRVRTVFAARTGAAVASTPPVERFHLFLKKQGLEALAGWWAITTQELRSLGDRHPTAATVLAASMLEAALVAIAEAGKKTGAWKRDFLEKPSKDWKLGALIDQAEVSSPEFAATFSKTDAVFARSLADLRNRIHVGKFAVEGPERFKPQFTNAHDAALALKHLELLLSKILDWPTVSALC